MEDIVTDPDNWRVPLWYKVRRPRQGYDFKAGVYVPRTSDDFVWYRDWRNVKDDDDEKADDRPKGRRLREAERDRDRVRRGPGRVEEGLVYRARRGRGKHGYPEMAAAVDWLKAHRDFMEDRATISRAAASIAWRKKRKNSNAADVASEVARLRSSLSAASSTGYDRNPPLASGSTIVENESTSLEWVKTDTGGSAALADERILRMMTGSGMGGIPNHLFGDEAAANLATALAMNTPLLKAYENWQQWLSDIVQDLIGFVLETAHDAGRIGPRDDSLRYVDRRTVERPDPSQPPPPGQQPPRLPPGPPPAASVPIREQDAHVRTSPDRLADAPELASREAFHAAGNIDPGAPAARQAEAFDRLPADAYVWVFHATKEPVRPFLNDGLRPDNLPVNVARGELPPPEEGGPDLPPADRTGTSVTGTVRYARKWGPRVIAMRVRKGDIHLRPESEAAGLTVGEVIVGEDGGLVRRVSPSDLVALGSGGSDDTYRAVSDAVRRLREAFAPGQPPAPGTVVPGGAPGPTPGQPPLPPPPRMLALTTMDRDLPSKRDPVDWYVDVDFSPIMQQDIKPFVESLKVVGELLPSVPESQRLIVTMALTALGWSPSTPCSTASSRWSPATSPRRRSSRRRRHRSRGSSPASHRRRRHRSQRRPACPCARPSGPRCEPCSRRPHGMTARPSPAPPTWRAGDGSPRGSRGSPAAPDPARMVARTRGRVERHLASGKGDVAEEVRRALEAGMRDAYMAGRASLGDRSDPDPTQEARLADLMVPALEGAERVLSSPLMAAVADARDAEAVRLARLFRAFAQRLAQMGAEEGLRRVEAAARIDATPTLPPGSEARWQVERARRRAWRTRGWRRSGATCGHGGAPSRWPPQRRSTGRPRRAVGPWPGGRDPGRWAPRWSGRRPGRLRRPTTRWSDGRGARPSNALAVPEEALATDPSDAEEAAERYVTPPGGDGGRRLRNARRRVARLAPPALGGGVARWPPDGPGRPDGGRVAPRPGARRRGVGGAPQRARVVGAGVSRTLPVMHQAFEHEPLPLRPTDGLGHHAGVRPHRSAAENACARWSWRPPPDATCCLVGWHRRIRGPTHPAGEAPRDGARRVRAPTRR